MSSSLAKQLKQLAQAPAASKQEVVSLLFDQREASRLDLDDVFDLGVNGLLELIQVSNCCGGYGGRQ
jgi:hypothetical protein